MQSISQILDGNPILTRYTGSHRSLEIVSRQIEARWGKEELSKLDCFRNLMTFSSWLALGYRVKRSEKAIWSIIFFEVYDEKRNLIGKKPRKVALFYYKQVEPINRTNHND